MGKVYYNGLHWCSPVDTEILVNDPILGNVENWKMSQPQFTAGQQFSSAYIIASGNIFYNNYNPGQNNWRDVVNWLKANTNRVGEIVLRLFWPFGQASYITGDPGQTLGNGFYDQIVRDALKLGIHNFQVLNELNQEYEPFKPRTMLAGDMYNIAYWIKHRAQTDTGSDMPANRTVYLGFPGPGGDLQDPTSQGWKDYWNAYKSTILHSTDQGSAYNWLAVHTYRDSASALVSRMEGQYDWLVNNYLPQYPQRFTEYGVPLFDYSNATDKFQARANDLAAQIPNFKRYVESKSGPDVWSLFNYIGYYTNIEASDQRNYDLVVDNAHLNPASTLSNMF